MLVSCTSVYQGRTIGKGKMAVETTLGGPILTDLGMPLPVPNLFTGLRYGLRNDLDIAAQYNILGPILPGIALDLITSVNWVPIQPGLALQSTTPDKGWGAGGVLDIQWVTNFKNGLVVLPSIDLVGSYRYRWISFFLGSAVGLNFYRIEDDDSKLSLSPFAGFEFITSKRLSFGVKCTAFDLLYNYNGSQAHWVYFVEDKEQRKKYAPFGISIGFGYEMKKRFAQ
ncbi:MAG TPA: hypothetical protein VHO70_12795 [Chitinispirillaceae bacterium]|nr:hypothetical protein [Chitinispirillaceae bacterium]